MKALALILLLTGAPALADDASRSARLVTPASAPRTALMITSQVFALLGGGAASVAVGSFWIEENFRVYGRPDPRVFAVNIALGMAVNMALAWLVLPDLARLTDDDAGRVDVNAIRQHTWRITRWVAAAGLIFVGVLVAGAVMEKDSFGRGQAVMAIGAAGAAACVLTFDITALLAVKGAAVTTREAR